MPLINMPSIRGVKIPSMLRWILSASLWCGVLFAQDGAVLIRGARVVDGTGAPARVADTLIRGGKIEAVGPGLTVPEGARVVDAAGRTLLPGLFDLHTHLSASAATGVAGDWLKNLKAYLACGVTTVNDFAPYVEMYAPMRKLLASGGSRRRVSTWRSASAPPAATAPKAAGATG